MIKLRYTIKAIVEVPADEYAIIEEVLQRIREDGEATIEDVKIIKDV